MRTFYIASGLSRAPEVRALAEALKRDHWIHTFDWTELPDLRALGESEGALARRDAANLEIRGVQQADVVFVLLPGGRGTYVELGAAIAGHKRIFVHVKDESDLLAGHAYHCAFLDHPLVSVIKAPDTLHLVSHVRMIYNTWPGV